MELYARAHRGNKSSLSVHWADTAHINNVMLQKIQFQLNNTQVLTCNYKFRTDAHNMQMMPLKLLLLHILCFRPIVPILNTLLHCYFLKRNQC